MGECRRATQPKANVVFVPIGRLVSAVLVLKPSRAILACMFVLASQSAAGGPMITADLQP